MTTAWQPLRSRKMKLRAWNAVLARSRVDPYLVWADACAFAGFASPRFDRVSIAFEFKDGDGAAKVVDQFRRPGDFALAIGKHFGVASVPIELLKWLLKPDVQQFFPRFELGMPLAGDPGTYVKGVTGNLRLATSGTATAPDLGAGSGPVAAVIDDGCPFAHASFRTRGDDGKWHTRIEHLWFQEDRIKYGFDAHTLDRWLNASGNGVVDEAACNRLMRDEFHRRLVASLNGDPRLADRWWQRMLAPATHGAHVLDVFAGAPNPLAERYGLGVADDTASKAPILFVQLPRGAIDDTTGLSMNVCVLEALAYIAGRVKSRPTVINLSFGSLAGPHNGSSLLESAIDDFLEQHSNVRLVLPAGNGYDYLTHASVEVAPDMRWQALPFRIFPDDPTDTFVELWYDPKPDPAAIGSRRRQAVPNALIEVELVAPDGTCSGAVGCNDAREAIIGKSKLPSAAIVHQSRPPTATSSPKHAVLIALAATRGAGRDRAPAPHGVWTLKVRNHGGMALAVDAWIERDDSAFGSGRSRSQAVFLSRGVTPARGHPHAATEPISRRACLNSIAHGRYPKVVGGSVIKPEVLASYSASGPGRLGDWPGPEYIAPCEETPGIGLQAAGTRSGSLVHMNGTSVAAPVVARMLLNNSDQPRWDSPLDTDGTSLVPPDHPAGHPLPDSVLRRGRRLVRP